MTKKLILTAAILTSALTGLSATTASASEPLTRTQKGYMAACFRAHGRAGWATCAQQYR